MHVRAGEASFQNHFRCQRFFQINGQWHFTTREQTVEGPYPSKSNAEQGLKRYVEMVNCRVFDASEQQSINALKVLR